MKKALALVLAICCLLSTLSTAFSVEQSADTGQQTTAENGAREYTQYVTYVNPIYADVISEDDLVKPEEENSIAAYSAPVYLAGSEDTAEEYLTDIEAAGAVLREGMKARQGTIVVRYKTAGDTSGTIKAILEEALEHTGDPTEGDCLRFQFAGYKAPYEYSNIGGFYCLTITYTVTYYTTAEQEKELDTAVGAVMESLNLSGKTDYEKVCAIYDYICGNITYDNANLDDDTCLLKYTAYAALVNKTAVCQGYANLFYRMALEAGVDARIVSGTTNKGEAHAWNIVKLGSKYYNLDSTWDAGRNTYSYFLKCDESFVNHTRNSSTYNMGIDYTSSEFEKDYPMSEKDYTPSGISVSGTVTSYGGDTDAVTVSLFPEGVSDAEYTVTVNGNTAGYSISDVDPGTYTMKVMKLNHVTREYVITVGSEAVTQDAKICLIGDVTGDGAVKINDVNTLYSHFCNISILTDYEFACGDVVGNDGIIKINDVNALYSHFCDTQSLWT